MKIINQSQQSLRSNQKYNQEAVNCIILLTKTMILDALLRTTPDKIQALSVLLSKNTFMPPTCYEILIVPQLSSFCEQ